MFFSAAILAQNTESAKAFDTIRITPENGIVFRDSILIPQIDTTLLIEQNTKYKVEKNPYKKSDRFCDSFIISLMISLWAGNHT